MKTKIYKKIIFILFTLIFSFQSFVFADELELESEKKEKYKYTKEKMVPEKREPKSINASDIKVNSEESEDYVSNCVMTFKYGLESEIETLIDELIKNEDLRFVGNIYDLFHVAKSINLKTKVLQYFIKIKDPCLCDFACTVINDPYDYNTDIVNTCFRYVSELDCKEAVPGLVDLVDKEEEKYFNGALTALGILGTEEEALFLSDYLDRDDLSVAQKQSLMKVLGKIKAIETWEKLSEIAQNEDENSFVRMYAAEAIGAMKKEESKEILIKLFESTDPNFRSYVVKGISYFDDDVSKELIMQALRDSQYKVRLEAIEAVKNKNMIEAVPFLVYRCKDKSEEKSVKDKSYEVIALLNTSEGNKYLISLLNDKKIPDNTKSKVSSELLKNNFAGSEEIIELARETLKDDLRKNLRYSLGKEFAKYGREEFKDICKEYLEHSDVSTQGTGLDIWQKGKYPELKPFVAKLAEDADYVHEDKTKPAKKINSNAKKAKKILSQVDSLYSKDSDVQEKSVEEEKTFSEHEKKPNEENPSSESNKTTENTVNIK